MFRASGEACYPEILLPCLHMCANMIQHIVKGISAPASDCRPPFPSGIVGGSVNTLGDLTHPAIAGLYIAPYGKAVNYKNLRELSGSLFSFAEISP